MLLFTKPTPHPHCMSSPGRSPPPFTGYWAASPPFLSEQTATSPSLGFLPGHTRLPSAAPCLREDSVRDQGKRTVESQALSRW